MSCIYPNLQSFKHLKQWDVVYTQEKSSREGEEGEKTLNQQYFPQMENVGDILSPRSIWLGKCFIWTGRLSGKAWCYNLLKGQREGSCNVVGNGTYACVSACNCMLMNIFVHMWLLAWRKWVRTVQSDDEQHITFHCYDGYYCSASLTYKCGKVKQFIGL